MSKYPLWLGVTMATAALCAVELFQRSHSPRDLVASPGGPSGSSAAFGYAIVSERTPAPAKETDAPAFIDKDKAPDWHAVDFNQNSEALPGARFWDNYASLRRRETADPDSKYIADVSAVLVEKRVARSGTQTQLDR